MLSLLLHAAAESGQRWTTDLASKEPPGDLFDAAGS